MAMIRSGAVSITRRRAGIALALCVALAACDVHEDDRAMSADDTPDAASQAEAPEPASGWRFVRIRASAADAGASMSARINSDPRLAASRAAVPASAAAAPPSASSAAAARRPIVAA
ncbi:cytochrome c, partial [Burkholderia latens]